MASNQTSNYGLNQWEATDQVLRTEFNADNSKIDAALKGLADKDTALEGTLASQAAEIVKRGNCSIEHFTYVGNGGYGSGSPTRITFSLPPVLFLIVGEDYFAFGSHFMNSLMIDLGENNAQGQGSWSGTRFSFTQGNAQWQLNTQNETYHVFAFYVA